MAALTHGGWFAGFLSRAKPKAGVMPQSRKVQDFSRRVYKETNGPTPELKQLLTSYLRDKQRSRDRVG